MRLQLKRVSLCLTAVMTLAAGWLPSITKAQTYPIDCAILLCLSGGWPASVPCSRARAEFIRRITPWPVEPPLQIWRCPMGASYETERHPSNVGRIFEALFHEFVQHQTHAAYAGSVWHIMLPFAKFGLILHVNAHDASL